MQTIIHRLVDRIDAGDGESDVDGSDVRRAMSNVQTLMAEHDGHIQSEDRLLQNVEGWMRSTSNMLDEADDMDRVMTGQQALRADATVGDLLNKHSACGTQLRQVHSKMSTIVSGLEQEARDSVRAREAVDELGAQLQVAQQQLESARKEREAEQREHASAAYSYQVAAELVERQRDEARDEAAKLRVEARKARKGGKGGAEKVHPPCFLPPQALAWRGWGRWARCCALAYPEPARGPTGGARARVAGRRVSQGSERGSDR